MLLKERISSCWVLLALLSCGSVARAQTLDHVGSFWGFTDVQFLPGGYVEENSDGNVKHYLYKNSKFESFRGELPALLKEWSSFDWMTDYLDQVDASGTLEANLRALLPKGARVKKDLDIMIPGKKSSLVLICYTRRLRIEGPNTTDIFVTAALNTNPYDTRSGYQKLWTRKLVSESHYGDFQYQVVPGLGSFFLLYSQVTGGDAVNNQLDVYRMKALEETGGKAGHSRVGPPPQSPSQPSQPTQAAAK